MEVRTLIRKDSNFVSIEEFNGIVSDKDYIEGAIIIEINHKTIFSTEHWDYVDQMWS